MAALRVLLTNIWVAGRSGTEIVTRDIALGLLRRGHRPIVYAQHLGPLATELRSASIPVVDRVAAIAERPDVIHGQHNGPLAAAVAQFPDVPAIFVCHDFTAWHDAPPFFPSILRYVAVDDTVADRLRIESGILPERVAVHRNAVDLERFRAPQRTLPDVPRRALAFVKHTAHLDEVRAACAARGLALDIAGTAAGKRLDKPEDVLGGYDLVFTSALSALEAMASGCAVIVCDARGLAGFVTPETYASWRPLNFGLRSLTRRVTSGALVDEIDRYDAAAAAEVTAIARDDGDLQRVLDQYVELYRACIAEGTGADRAAHDGALARHVETWAPGSPLARQVWPWMLERERLLSDVDAALERPPCIRAGESVELGLARPRSIEAVAGFGEPEAWGVWTNTDVALLAFRSDVASGILEIAFYVDAFVVPEHPSLQVDLRVNGQRAAAWSFDYPHQPGWRTLRAQASPEGTVLIEFAIATPRAPSELGVSGDVRRLGLSLHRLEVRAVSYEDAES